MFENILRKLGISILCGVLFTLTLMATYAVQTGVGFDEIVGDIKLSASGAVQTGTTATNTALLQAYDTDGSVYSTFATLTANDTPTFDLASATTIGSQSILNTSSIGSSVQAYDEELGELAALVEAKGSVIAGTGAGWSALAVGDDGEALTAQADGSVAWEASAGGAYSRSCSQTVCTSDSIDKTNCDQIGDGTADDVQIQAAITAVSADQGGKVCIVEGTYDIDSDIIMASNVILSGMGAGTILNRSSATNTIDNSGAITHFVVENISFTATTENAVGLINATTACSDCVIRESIFSTSDRALDGIWTNSTVTENHFDMTEGSNIIDGTWDKSVVSNNQFDAPSGSNSIAWDIGTQSDNLFTGNYVRMIPSGAFSNVQGVVINGGGNNTIASNIFEGLNVAATITGQESVFMNNYVLNARWKGVDGSAECTACAIIGNVFSEWQYAGEPVIYLDGNVDYTIVMNNTYNTQNSGNPGNFIDLSSANASYNIITGNSCYDCNTSVVNLTGADPSNIVYNNHGSVKSAKVDERRLVLMKNVSGGALAKGDVVVYDPSANGDEVNTTVTADNDFVYGVSMQTPADAAYGLILVEGGTVDLKVDGTTDIAIGDWLCTFTSAGIAAKCGAGGMAFGIAREAYATDDSSGVIDALIIPPRKID